MAAAASSSGPRERIAFQFGITEQVTLDSEGTEQTGRDGSTEYRYFLGDRKIMWVPETVHDDIQRLGAEPGDILQITKHKHGRNTVWAVEPVARESAAAAAIRATETAPASRPAAAQQQQRRQEPTPGQPAQASFPAGEPFSTSMYTCMCAAIRVAAAAEKFASEIGRPLAFETGDIRAMAASLFIHATEGR